MRRASILVAAVLILGLLASTTEARRPRRHQFEERDLIPLYVNKIGPYANPSETYAYYSLPLCQPAANEIQHRHKTFHEAIEGDRPQSSLYKIHFMVDVLYQSLCTLHVGDEEAKELMNAIKEEYYFEFQYDGIPIRGFLGTIDRSDGTEHYLLFKHMHFTILYNGPHVIFANVTPDLSKLHDLREEEQEIEFSFSASWHPTDVRFKDRSTLIRDNFFSGSSELEIHWLSIMNSIVLVVLLTGFIIIIVMRVLKSDYTRYQRTDEEDDEEDYGWKLIHGDVFRYPEHKMLLSSMLGNGSQFLFLTIFLLILHVVGVFYPGSGNSLYTAALVLYALTACIAGYISASFYKQIGGEKWAWNIMFTACVFSVPFLTMALLVNIIASHYAATTAISFGTIVLVILIWAGLGFPLTVVGGVFGKRLAADFYAPVRTKNAKREIPSIPWYRRAPFQYLMAGFLPFSAIYIELYYVFASVWGHSHYTLYGILLLVAVILVIVTACITIALTYFQLAMEDYHWWWRSFISGGSTGFFIFLYSCFYYLYRSRMSGFLQATFFFGYMAGAAYFFFLMLGTVGFYSALTFVRRIYSNLHCD